MEEMNERINGGTLPDWEVAELPAPPQYQFARAQGYLVFRLYQFVVFDSPL